MSKKNIFSIGRNFPLDEVTKLGFKERKTLAEADIVYFSFNSFFDEYFHFERFEGAPSFDNADTASLIETAKFWKRELKDFVSSGKTLFFELSPPKKFFVQTGKQQHSGTGRNRVTTNMVTSKDLYVFFPFSIGDVHSSQGSKSKFLNHIDGIKPYYDHIKEYVAYEAVLESFKGKAWAEQVSTQKVLGGVIQEGAGNIVIVPSFDVNDAEGFTKTVKVGETDYDTEEWWSEKAIGFFQEFRKRVIDVDYSLRSGMTFETAPEWVTDSDKYLLPQVKKTRTQIDKLERDRAQLDKKIQLLKETEETQNLPLVLLYG